MAPLRLSALKELLFGLEGREPAVGGLLPLWDRGFLAVITIALDCCLLPSGGYPSSLPPPLVRSYIEAVTAVELGMSCYIVCETVTLLVKRPPDGIKEEVPGAFFRVAP
jgi:hypothetical protein